jgi:DedD protein
MEKKKILLVAISVGVFLVIVISASILIVSPKTPGAGTVSSSSRLRAETAEPIAAGTSGNPAALNAADLVRNPDGAQNIQAPASATAIQETTFYINGEKPIDSYQIEKRDGDASAKVVINIPKPSTAAVPDFENRGTARPAENRTAPARTEPVSQVRPADPAPQVRIAEPLKPASQVRPANPAPQVKPAEPAKPAAQAKPAEPARPALKTHNDYWVQTGAFSTKLNAEGVKETLSSKGITSIIENREIEGKTWYRVRVGPYTSENEANYWLALVKGIDGFADSQIRQTSSVR